MRGLALDQSILSCGYAVWQTGWAFPRCDFWPLADKLKWVDGGFVRLQQNMMALHREEPLDFVVYEQPLKLPTDNRDKLIGLYGLVAHIMSFCRALGIPYYVAGIDAWRSHFIPPAPLSEDWKWLAVKRCQQLGIETPVHDAAEAVGILSYQLHVLGVQPPWAKAGELL